MKAPVLGAQQAIRLAVGGLWLRVLCIAALSVYTLAQLMRGAPTLWLPLIDFVGAAILVALWTPLMADFLRGQPVLTTDSRRRAVTMLYPWLVAYEGALWLLFSFFPVLLGASQANPLASFLMVAVSGASVAVSFLVYLVSLRLMPNPADMVGRAQLADLFNLAAALSAAGVVFSLVPLVGEPAPSTADRWAYALANAAELLSWLLLRWAMQAGRTGESHIPEKE